MNCNVCGTENNADRKFCRECGNALTVTCPNCEAANEPGDKFCGNCGHSLDVAEATTATSQPAAPEQPEQRFVSILFADIVGYTALSENRDSEDIRDLLTVYFDRAREIIERFGGAVDKFIGDAVMGVWGATVAMEDDAQRAVRAAIELVDMVEALGEEKGIDDLMLRAGVNSGTTSVGPGGNEKGLVVGDLVNTASRLQSIADPGTVFVGPATYEVTQRSIDYEDLGTRDVKGKSEPVSAYRAVRVASLVQGRVDDEIRQPPFVGRERELRLLKDGLAAVEAEQRARLISIVGEAGIGKTRLAEEFKKIIDGYTQSIYWHWGRSPSYGDGVTFWALGEIIRSRARIVEGEEPTRSRTRLRTMLAEFVSEERDRDWIEPRLSGLLGFAEMPSDSRSELFAALRSLFQNIALQGPVVLVFEDLHWADAGLVAFITELVERSTRSPILVVTLARPDLLDRAPDWGTQHRSSMGVRLGPLPDDDMRQLMSEYIPGVPAEVIDQIVERVSGFPLYAVEIVRMLSASGDLVHHRGEFNYVGDSSDMALPETLQTVIGARLDRLPSEQRSLLQDAAVLGHTFTAAGLSALTGRSAEQLQDELGSLITLELLDIEDDPRSPERGQYRFVQSLIREAAYNRLNRDDRRTKHIAVAEYFESFDDPELAGVISSHYMGAFEASPDGSAKQSLAEKALGALSDAAMRAAELHSHNQAMDLFDQAIAIAPDDETRTDLRLRAVDSANRHGDVDKGLGYVLPVRDLAEKTGDIKGLRRAAAAQSNLLNSHFRSAEALEAVEDIYRDLETIDDEVDVSLVSEAARSFALMIRLDLATAAADLVLDNADRFDVPQTLLNLLITKGTALSMAGRRLEGYTILRGAAAEAEKRGLLQETMRATNNLAAALTGRNPVESANLVEGMLELVERLGDQAWLLRVKQDTALHRDLRQGTYERGEEVLDDLHAEGMSEFSKLRSEVLRSRYDLRRSGRVEDFERAWGVYNEFTDDPDPQGKNMSRVLAAEILLEMGRWEEAFEQAIEADPSVFWLGRLTATIAASWLGEPNLVSKIRSEGMEASIPRLDDFLEAVELAMSGALMEAGDLFESVISFWSTRLWTDYLVMAKLAFAKLVGPDHPAAAQAAQEAYEWCKETGTQSFLNAFAEVMPAPDRAAAAG